MTKSERRLCDNPACPSHCKVVNDKRVGWRFANGFQSPLTKDQLAHFQPQSAINVCGSCKGVYGYMLNRAREIARRHCRK